MNDRQKMKLAWYLSLTILVTAMAAVTTLWLELVLPIVLLIGYVLQFTAYGINDYFDRPSKRGAST